MIITNHRTLKHSDLDSVVSRYLTFSKFASLLTYNALWFPKLNVLQDKFEGTMPRATKQLVHQSNESWKAVFATADFRQQIDEMPDRNVRDGRELLAVSCWFLGEQESQRMWDEYVGSPEGVAIKTTIRSLSENIYVLADPKISQIGLVQYVDHERFVMSPYEANQAVERAFIKDKEHFGHEQELRIATMNWKTPNCVAMNGRRFSAEECAGSRMNNFENPGLYVGADIRKLVQSIVLAPQAPGWFECLVKRIVELSHLEVPVSRSSLESD